MPSSSSNAWWKLPKLFPEEIICIYSTPANRCFITQEVTSSDNSSVQFARELEIGCSGCRLATMKRPLSKIQSLSIRSYNEYEVQVILGQDCYDIHHPLEFKKSGEIAALWAKNIEWALSGPYHRIRPRILLQQQPHLRKTNLKASWVSGKISILTLRIAILPIIWEINRENSRHWSKQLGSSGEILEVGLLWRKDKVKFSRNFYSAMGQIKSLERRLHKDQTVRGRYQEIFDTDVKARFVCKIEQLELNQTRDKLQWYLPHHLAINQYTETDWTKRKCAEIKIVFGLPEAL